MSNDVLTAVPLFLFMGYIVERANIVDRLFSTLNHRNSKRVPGSMARRCARHLRAFRHRDRRSSVQWSR
jgi:TRAP-type mannitol/chloroaromatic compound transport system permease large subunit